MSDNQTLGEMVGKMFKGRDCIFGVNKSLHNSIIKDTTSTREEKTESYSQLGKDATGQCKGKTCWKYVHQGTCQHISDENNNVKNTGQNIANLWHPSNQECEYLKNLKKK